MDCLKINLKLLPVKASFFFILGAVASLLPFLAVFMHQAGLNGQEISVIYGTMPFLGAFIRPFFGAVADKWRKHKLILAVCCVMTGIFHGLLLVVPHHTYGGPTSIAGEVDSSDLWVSLRCGTSSSRISFCPEEILKNRGCTEVKANLTEIKHHGPLESMKNCSLRCRFHVPSNATRLCLHHGRSESCPLQRQTSNDHFHSLPTIQDNLKHQHTFHHLIKKHFIGIFFELEEIDFINISYDTEDQLSERTTGHNICYNYDLRKIQYNGSEFSEEHQNSSSHPAITCDADALLKCDLDCDVLPDLDNIDGFDCSREASKLSIETPRFGRIFWMFFLIYFFAQMWFSPIFNLTDGIVYDHLGEDRLYWGRQRLWGTIGFMFFAVISGFAIEYFSSEEVGQTSFTPAFVLFVINSFLAAILVCFYKISPDVQVKQILTHVKDVLMIPEVVVLFTCVLIFGIYTGVIETFLFIHLEDLGAPAYLLGICLFFNCIPEVGIFFFASNILEKLGHVLALCLVFVAYFVRMLIYAVITDAWYVLFVEPLHGITFGLMYAAASSYGSLVSPDGMHGTVQGLIGGLHFGIGKGIGSWTSGTLVTWVQFHHLFLIYAISSLAVLMLYIAFNIALRRYRAHSRGRAVPTRDTNGFGHSDRNGNVDDVVEPDQVRISALYDDPTVTFEKDKQTLVFKDDPDI